MWARGQKSPFELKYFPFIQKISSLDFDISGTQKENKEIYLKLIFWESGKLPKCEIEQAWVPH